ncbi:hypothetical protein I656_03161 [Geobacillus sp. WSUCF1]|nr:hypothetical protein I656_03161 [Geobacillus sp. WSUCF1]
MKSALFSDETPPICEQNSFFTRLLGGSGYSPQET